MKRALFAITLLLAPSAHAIGDDFVRAPDEPAHPEARPRTWRDCSRMPVDESWRPGNFNTLGSPCRAWEASSTTALDTNRTLTQSFDFAHAFSITEYLKLVARVRLGIGAALDTGFYSLEGAILALGLRNTSYSGNHAFEAGLRVIPNWSGPNNTNPAMQEFALGAAISSSMNDDALWLPFSNFGAQVYVQYESRSHPIVVGKSQFLVGIKWDGKASLGPMQVASWLGPQEAFIGNLGFEVFMGAPTIHNQDVNLQLGAHGEISLSSIWPGNRLFPAMFDVFLGWSPTTWFALRVFLGGGAPLLDPDAGTTHYGARVAFYMP